MADLFDLRVGGAGWHLTSHLIAIAALFVACFAITGYISFRDDSVPPKALETDQSADDDLKVNDIEASGNVSLDGTLTLSNVALNGIDSIQNLATAFGELYTKGINTASVDLARLRMARHFLGTKTSLTTIESRILFQDETGVASKTTTLAVAGGASNAAAVPSFDQPLFLTGDIDVAVDMTNNKLADFTGGGQQVMYIFGGNTFNTVAAISVYLSTDTTDTFRNDYFSMLSSSTTPGVYNHLPYAGTDAKLKIIITPSASGVKILPGSFIYFESTDANTLACKSFIETSGGTVAITTA